MDNTMQIGDRIRIISHGDVHYEGTVVRIEVNGHGMMVSNVFLAFEPGNIRYEPLVFFGRANIKSIMVLGKPFWSPMSCDLYALQIASMTAFLNSCAGMNRRRFQNRLLRKKPRSNNTVYKWRIPKFTDYIGRSGDPRELTLRQSNKCVVYKQDYDFEKFNKIFDDLCDGFAELALTELVVTNNGGKTETFADDSGISSDCQSSTVASKGAIPKGLKACQQPSNKHSTAYNKSNSFFDKISNSANYCRVHYRNPNWREQNIETFGAPMIQHKRRMRRSGQKYLKPNSVLQKKGGNISTQNSLNVANLNYRKKSSNIKNNKNRATSTPYKKQK